MQKVRVLIVAKTRRGAGACIGGITADGRSVRLEAANAGTDERAGLEYQVGDVWEVEAAPATAITLPHSENVVVFAKRRLAPVADPVLGIERFMPPTQGDVSTLYEGLTRSTPGGALYITERTGVPPYSTCFWRPDQPLRIDVSGKRIRYRYPTPDGGHTLTFVGFQDPVAELPAGALLRVSLAHWWRAPDAQEQELRCYLQLSGWFLPSTMTQPAASPIRQEKRLDDAELPGQATMPDLAQARRLLKEVFGFDTFRPFQDQVIASLLAGRDTLAILPTGGGKSLCYQLPALLWDGLTVVVSPLIALMQDQVDALRELDIPAVYLNSTLDYTAYLATVGRVRAGVVKLLYVAPESLLRPEVLLLLDQSRVACLTIDEAHCISQWGHDFRQEYRQLLSVRQRYAQAVCLALTATAAPRVQRDISQTLGFAAAGVFIAGFDRANLTLSAQARTNGLHQLQTFLAAHATQAGIIYCSTRKQVDTLVAQLGLLGYAALPYHAGLEDKVRAHNQRAFVRDEVAIMVATVAFGMGINKSNVRFVVHYTLPPSLEHYYQEVGRAGRDGLPAECLLLYSQHDVQLQVALMKEGAESERPGRQARLQAMLRYAQSRACRRISLLAYFGETFTGAPCRQCDNCLLDQDEIGKTDVTEAAQRFLICVQQTRERFGITYVIQVLRGSRAQKVYQFRHERLEIYGAGRDLSELMWKTLAQELIQQGLIDQDMEHGTLSLTNKGCAALQNKETVFAVLTPEATTNRPSSSGAPAYDELLFEVLRRLRRTLAEAANVPAYVVFSDRTLVEMATVRPLTPHRLLTINGVGFVKLEKYGEQFLAAIQTYCREHGLDATPAMPKAE